MSTTDASSSSLAATAASTAEYVTNTSGFVLLLLVSIVLALHLLNWLYTRITYMLAPWRLGQPWTPPVTATISGGSRPGIPEQQPLVLITGGVLGVGREVAERYGKLGYHVVVWDILHDRFEAVKEELVAVSPPHARFEFHVVNVADPSMVQHAASKLEASGMTPDLLVLNAGVINGRQIVAGPRALSRIRRLIDINVFHLYNVTGHVLHRMLQASMKEEMSNGRPYHRGVVVMGSVAGFVGTARNTDYNASKAAANVFAEALGAEVREAAGGAVNFRVTVICPYQIATGMLAGARAITGFSELRPGDVADSIVRGVRLKKHIVVLPYLLLFLYMMKSILPWALIPWVDWIVGGSRAMNTFKGRGDPSGNGSSSTAADRTPPPRGLSRTPSPLDADQNNQPPPSQTVATVTTPAATASKKRGQHDAGESDSELLGSNRLDSSASLPAQRQPSSADEGGDESPTVTNKPAASS